MKIKLIIALLLISTQSHALTIMCSNGIIKTGDSKEVIEEKCPNFKAKSRSMTMDPKTKETHSILKLKKKLGDGTEVTLILLNDALLTEVIHEK